MSEHRALLLPIFAIALVTATAQSGSPLPAPTPHGAISFGFGPAGMLIPPTKNAPFSGVLVTQTEQTLEDGTHINRESPEVVMRDSQGRIYRARTIKRPGADQQVHQMIAITDPKTEIELLCNPLKICRTMLYRYPSKSRRPPFFDPNKKNPNITVEELGTSAINGIEVEGKRITHVIPEGMIGNDRAFTVVEETWHSRELDIDVQVKHTDPRAGTHTTTMTEIIASEPDPKYFQVPEGYRVEPMGIMPQQPRPLEPLSTDGISRVMPLPPNQ